MEAEITSTAEEYNITVSGLSRDVSILHDSSVTGILNLTQWMEDNGVEELTPGTYTIPVTFNLAEDITVTPDINIHIRLKNDGVRGIANEELTPLLAMQLGQAGAYVLTKENEHKPTIMVGCDTRISGDMLANALMAGACSVGANCIYVGVIPTPAVAYLTKKYKVDAGVVISASHNPVEFNGIKFFDGNGYKLPDAMEDEIEALIRNNMPGIKFPIGPGVGKIKYRTDAREEYINHAMRAVNVDLTGLKIVVDCAEGASFYTSVECLKELGGSVVAIHNNPDGTNINANCGSTHMEERRQLYEEQGNPEKGHHRSNRNE